MSTFSELQATFVIKDLMSVVKYCHQMGVIHRDIKPEYILFTGTPPMSSRHSRSQARVKEEGCDRLGEPT